MFVVYVDTLQKVKGHVFMNASCLPFIFVCCISKHLSILVIFLFNLHF